jgi:hypothetical protein
MSDIEGKVAREAMSECGQRASFNEVSGTSDMDGKAARVAETEAGAEGIKITSRAHVCPYSRIRYDVTSRR